MAKRNIIAEFVRYDKTHEEGLRVYQNKQGLRGTLFNSYGNIISSEMFYDKEKSDDTLSRLKEHFGFTDDNSYQTILYF